MRIEKVETMHVRIPLKKPTRSAHGTTTLHDSVVVRIYAEGKQYGLGGIDPMPHYDPEPAHAVVKVIESQLAPLVMRQDPFQIRKIIQIMDAEVPHHWGAKAAIEIALFDLLGKQLGVPIHVLLGGRIKDEIHLNGWIGAVEPEQAKKEARGWLEGGFRSVKVKIDPDVATGIRRVAAVRAEGKEKLQVRVDANESLNMTQALETLKGMSNLDILYLEQPFPREGIQDLASLAKSSHLKLMADESVQDLGTLMQVLKTQAAQYVKLKIQKQGGFLKVQQMAEIAEAFGVPVILGHGFGLTISTLAELHLAASCQNIIDGCESVGPIKMSDDVVKDPIRMEKGTVPVPMKPGLGTDLDEEKIKKYRVSVVPQ